MRSTSNQALHDAIRYGLLLHSAVQRGEPLNLAKEQAALTNLALETADGGAEGAFRGARYALICWLDELFICHSTWSEQWNERKLESALYSGNDRAWEFWRQAKLAAAQTTDDALNAYYLCVALGFRGNLRNDPRALAEWFDQTRTRVTRAASQRTPSVRPLGRKTTSRRLHGESRMRRFVAVATVVTICLAPLATYAVMQRIFA